MTARRTVRLRFRRFWSGFRPHDSFFVRCVKHALGDQVDVKIERSPRKAVDLEFVSVFRDPMETFVSRLNAASSRTAEGDRALRMTSAKAEPSRTAQRSVWFTGENLRPPAGDWDAYLSFDLDTLGGRNIYHPLWFNLLDWFGPSRNDRLGAVIARGSLLKPRSILPEKREKFCCAFIGNDHPMRAHAIAALQEFGPVDVYGRAVGRPVNDKISIAKDYRFSLCFENDVYPGYVTEKPLEAWWSGTVPIWWGCDIAGYLNPSALVHLGPGESLDTMASRVGDLWTDSDAWCQVASAPFLKREPTIDGLLLKLRSLLE